MRFFCLNPFGKRQMGLKIGGLVGFTTQDYPGKLACVVFVRGCPWRCGYCHNPHLQSRATESDDLSWEDLLHFLSRRQGLLDAVVFSGGEPTLDPDLFSAIDDVKSMGFLVGLHTAGCYPDKLEKILHQLDWVGLDIKAEPEDYDELTGCPGSSAKAFEALKLLLSSGIPMECRTTIAPQWLPEKKLNTLAERLHQLGVRRWVLQPFRRISDGRIELSSAAKESYPSAALLDKCQGLFEEFLVRQ